MGTRLSLSAPKEPNDPVKGTAAFYKILKSNVLIARLQVYLHMVPPAVLGYSPARAPYALELEVTHTLHPTLKALGVLPGS